MPVLCYKFHLGCVFASSKVLAAPSACCASDNSPCQPTASSGKDRTAISLPLLDKPTSAQRGRQSKPRRVIFPSLEGCCNNALLLSGVGGVERQNIFLFKEKREIRPQSNPTPANKQALQTRAGEGKCRTQ